MIPGSIMNTPAFIIVLASFCLQHDIVCGHSYLGPAITERLTIDYRGYTLRLQHSSTKFNGVVRTPFDRWLNKRQANEEPTTMLTEQERRVCAAKSNDIFCSYLQQSVIDVNLSCGKSIDSVRQNSNGYCGRNEKGVSCQIVIQQLYFDSDILSNIAGNCSTFGVVNTSSPCSSQCKALLENFKRIAGCCVRNYISGTTILIYVPYNDVRVALDYRVWNWCSVSLPPTTCETGLTINPPPGLRDNCTNSEFIVRTYTQHFCLPHIGQPFIDALLSDNDCYQVNNSTAQFFVSSCQIKPDGSYCISAIYADQATTSQYHFTTRLRDSCASSSISCNQTCRNGIIEAKKMLGCCVNFFNTSNFTSMFKSPALSYTVWKTCGVDSPGFCDSSTLKLNNGAITSFTGKNTWMITFFLLLPVHLAIIM